MVSFPSQFLTHDILYIPATACSIAWIISIEGVDGAEEATLPGGVRMAVCRGGGVMSVSKVRCPAWLS